MCDLDRGTAGGADVISGFEVDTDHLRLFGYDSSTMAQTATGAGLILTLTDGTRVTLLGVTQLGADSLRQRAPGSSARSPKAPPGAQWCPAGKEPLRTSSSPPS